MAPADPSQAPLRDEILFSLDRSGHWRAGELAEALSASRASPTSRGSPERQEAEARSAPKGVARPRLELRLR